MAPAAASTLSAQLSRLRQLRDVPNDLDCRQISVTAVGWEETAQPATCLCDMHHSIWGWESPRSFDHMFYRSIYCSPKTSAQFWVLATLCIRSSSFWFSLYTSHRTGGPLTSQITNHTSRSPTLSEHCQAFGCSMNMSPRQPARSAWPSHVQRAERPTFLLIEAAARRATRSTYLT